MLSSSHSEKAGNSKNTEFLKNRLEKTVGRSLRKEGYGLIIRGGRYMSIDYYARRLWGIWVKNIAVNEGAMRLPIYGGILGKKRKFNIFDLRRSGEETEEKSNREEKDMKYDFNEVFEIFNLRGYKDCRYGDKDCGKPVPANKISRSARTRNVWMQGKSA